MQKKFIILEQILNFLNDGIFAVDTNFKITFFNHFAERITGVLASEAINQKCSDVFKTPLCNTKDCPLKNAIKLSKQISDIKTKINIYSQKSIPISVTAGPIYNLDGEIIGGIEVFHDISDIEILKKEINEKYTLYDIVGKSEFMKTLFEILPDISESDCNILIEGPSGSGKSLLAKTIHNLSERSKKPFIVVNCGAIPDTLLESELFGYVRGAFTDAKHDKPGRFELAEGGTIFLDEIAEIPFHLQAKLLRVIEDKCYEPLGSIKTKKANVRIISATNKDLFKMVKEEKFREDLYYRLKIVNIKMPALKDRREDIELLVWHFINKFNVIKNNKITNISDEVLKFFINYDFPGNVRELENILEYSYIFCKNGKLTLNHLPQYYQNIAKSYSTYNISKNSFKVNTLNQTLDDIEKLTIINALKQFNGNKTKTANYLKIDYSTLWRKIKKYNIKY